MHYTTVHELTDTLLAVLDKLKEARSEGLDWTSVEDLVDLVSDQLESPNVLPTARELGYTMDIMEDYEDDDVSIGALVGLFKSTEEEATKDKGMTMACDNCGHDWVIHYAENKPVFYQNKILQPCQMEDCFCGDFKDTEVIKDYAVKEYKPAKEPEKSKYDAAPMLNLIEGGASLDG